MEEVQEKLVTGIEAEQIVQEEKKEIRYKKIDCESGYLTDEVEVGNYKIYQRRDIVNNLMLGDFNEKGDYVLNSNLLQVLVNVKKQKSGDYSDIMFLNSVESFEGKGQLKFSITIQDSKDTSGNKIAVLKLLEPVKKMNGYIENTNSFIIASYKDVADESFMGKVLKVFHIIDPTNTEVGKEDPAIVNAIIERLKFLYKYKNAYLLDIDAQEQAYYYARLEILKDPKFEQILIEYKKHLTKASMFIDPTSPDYYAKLNELLDLAIDMIATKNRELGMLATEMLKPIVVKHNEICEARHNEILNEVKGLSAENENAPILGVAAQNSKKAGGKSASHGKSKGGGGGGGRRSGGGSSKGGSGGGKKPQDKGGFTSSKGGYRYVDSSSNSEIETSRPRSYEELELIELRNKKNNLDQSAGPFGDSQIDNERNL